MAYDADLLVPVKRKATGISHTRREMIIAIQAFAQESLMLVNESQKEDNGLPQLEVSQLRVSLNDTIEVCARLLRGRKE